MNEQLQGDSEYIANYYYGKLQLCQHLNLSFAEIKDHIILGIHSQELAVYAMRRSHTTSAELQSDIQEGRRLIELRRVQYSLPDDSGLNVKSVEYKQSRLESRPNGNCRYTDNVTPNPSGSSFVRSTGPETQKVEHPCVRCYNCNATGHIAKDCPGPQKPCSGVSQLLIHGANVTLSFVRLRRQSKRYVLKRYRIYRNKTAF